MMTDPIADLLTRIRNALRNKSPSCSMPGSGMKVRVLDVLKREGFILGYEVHSDGPRSLIDVQLKYGPDGEQVVSGLKRVSSPGCRRYRGVDDLPRVRGGLGIAIVSTNAGVLSDRECREKRVGGEVLCTVE
ncbi:MAG: 30S ribosomal protein S8 [Planctomycetes bacterium]|nr:30S ribosomal protein S8 [Planctomycetota bacterium]